MNLKRLCLPNTQDLGLLLLTIACASCNTNDSREASKTTTQRPDGAATGPARKLSLSVGTARTPFIEERDANFRRKHVAWDREQLAAIGHKIRKDVPHTKLSVIFDYRPEACGSGGCTLLIIDKSSSPEAVVGDVFGITPPISVYPSSKRYPDFGSWIPATEGVERPCPVRISRVDGKYPFSVSSRGATKTGHVGQVLITGSEVQ